MFKKSSHRLMLSIVFILVCAGALFLWNKNGGAEFKTDAEKIKLGTLSSAGKEESSTKKPYLHGDNSFTFEFPGDFTFSALNETQDDGTQAETVIFVGNAPKRNFQIHIANYSTYPALTPAIIQKEIPDMLVENPEMIAVAGSKAVAFVSGPKDGTLRTREIWFIREGKLYQISTYKEFDTEMADMLGSWKWQ